MAQRPRSVLPRALLLFAGVALPLGRPSAGEPGIPTLDHSLPVTIESGFWARERGEVVMGSIPATAFESAREARRKIDPASVRLLSSDGSEPVPFRLSLGGDGLPDRLALPLTQPLGELSSAQYALRFRWSQTGADHPSEVSAPGADIQWPDDDPQLLRRRNGNFEAGGANVEGWSLLRGEVCTENPHSGQRCVKLTQPVMAQELPTLTSQAFPLSPDCRYTLSLRARGAKIGEEGTLLSASLYFLDADRRSLKTQPFRVHFGSRDLPGTWTTLSASEAAPPETRYGEVRIHIYRACGTLWIDDVEVFRPVSARLAPAIVRFESVTENSPRSPQ